MKMSFYKLLIISNLWGYLTACHAGGREFEPRPHRWKRSLALAKLRFFVYAVPGVNGAGSRVDGAGSGIGDVSSGCQRSRFRGALRVT